MKTPPTRADLSAGFLVFLIALPLCLGIAAASGFPPVAGILTAVVGGIVSPFVGGARLTIKGPAAGMIVIVLGAVTELSHGVDPVTGYRRTLAVGVIAGLLQIALALSRAGVIGEMMPRSVVHGMLAAIGVIILSKQTHILLGVTPTAKDPLGLLAEIPASLLRLNPAVFLIGALSLLALFGLPRLRARWARALPGPVLVLLLAVPLALLLGLGREHSYAFAGHTFSLGPHLLIRLPDSPLGALAFPDFSVITGPASIRWILLFALVGSVESLLSVSAVDALDPEKRASDPNRDLLAVGVGNTLAALIGGLPMISEIVRSKANIDAGARSGWANFFHGLFLLLSVALVPRLLQNIPLAALAAMLIFTGSRLASPREFRHAWKVGPDQLFVFLATMTATLMTDLLIGILVGLCLELLLHLANGTPPAALFRSEIAERRDGDTLHLGVHHAAVFTNYPGLGRRLAAAERDAAVRRVVVDFGRTRVVDHTVLGRLHGVADRWHDRELVIAGLDGHRPMSGHGLAARRRRVPREGRLA